MNKKTRILTIILIAITIFTSGCVSSDGYYNGIKWDSTISDVEKKLDGNITISDDKSSILQVIENFEGIDGSQAWVIYYFKNEKLCEISITPSTLDTTTITNDELNKQLYNILVKKYGECSESNSKTHTWSTQNSIITFMSGHIKYIPNK